MLCIAFQARGIDVQQVSLVINYDLPTNRENYIHRLVGSVLRGVAMSAAELSTEPHLLFPLGLASNKRCCASIRIVTAGKLAGKKPACGFASKNP